MNDDKPKCETCRHYLKVRPIHGECRAAPPKLDSADESVWPVVVITEWCSQHQAEEEHEDVYAKFMKRLWDIPVPRRTGGTTTPGKDSP